MNEVAVFALVGTGAAIDVKCGFVPAYVRVVNIESATVEELEWFRGMADASAIKTVTGTVARTKITTNGITPLGAGAADAVEQGFRIGADTDVNVAGEDIVAFAYRGGPGNQF
ncbi:hypothetical protein [Sphingobium yanoikuyae]|uniref:hypothetical protein n=1 Tax=Sphingobium yanoikuyae TaxID=13690 RepID=UPI0035C6A64C